MTDQGTAVPPEADAERDLLTQAEDALHSVAMRLLAVSPQLKTPYTDMPEQSAWSMFIGPQARRAHDLAQAIRKHLGLPYRHATRALGTPALEVEDAVAQAVAAERAQVYAEIRQLATERGAVCRKGGDFGPELTAFADQIPGGDDG